MTWQSLCLREQASRRTSAILRRNVVVFVRCDLGQSEGERTNAAAGD